MPLWNSLVIVMLVHLMLMFSFLLTYLFFTWLVGMHHVSCFKYSWDFAMLTRGFSKVDSWGFGWSFTRTLLTGIIVDPINYSLEILFITTPFINNTIHNNKIHQQYHSYNTICWKYRYYSQYSYYSYRHYSLFIYWHQFLFIVWVSSNEYKMMEAHVRD